MEQFSLNVGGSSIVLDQSGIHLSGDNINLNQFGTGLVPCRNNDFWVGDVPPWNDPWNPNPQIFPIPQKMTPWLPMVPYIPEPYQPAYDWWPPVITTTVTGTSLSPWRTTVQADRVIASIDMPGVKQADLNVEMENGSIKAYARRFDTGCSQTLNQYVGPDYDPRTAEAVLEAGILTVTVMRFKDKTAHKVNVTVK